MDSDLTELESERLDVAEHHLSRLLRVYKQKPREGTDLKRLKAIESAVQHLEIARLL